MHDRDRVERHRTEVLLVLSAFIVLAVSALPAQNGRMSGAERAVFRWINDLPGLIHGPLVVVMQLGNVITIFAVAAAALLFRRYRLAFGLTVAGLGAYYGARAVKQLVDRGRPADLLDDVREREANVEGLGYVSGHAAVAFAVVTVATMWLAPRTQAALWALAASVVVRPGLRRRSSTSRCGRWRSARDRVRCRHETHDRCTSPRTPQNERHDLTAPVSHVREQTSAEPRSHLLVQVRRLEVAPGAVEVVGDFSGRPLVPLATAGSARDVPRRRGSPR